AEVPAPADGVIAKLLVQVDDEVKVGAPLAEMEAGVDGAERAAGPVAEGASSSSQAAGEDTPSTPAAAGAAASDAAATGAPSAGAVAANGGDGVRATPVARRVAAASGVDLSKVKGTGPGEKVTKDDVLAAADGGGNGAAAAGEAKQLRGP